MTQERDFHSDPVFLCETIRANLILLSSNPTQTVVDAILLHDRSYGDHTYLFETAARIYQTDHARFIATPNTDGSRTGRNIPGEASPGKEWTVRQLLLQGIPIESIKHPNLKSTHTWEENQAFVQLGMKMRWGSAALLTQPHQLLRAMLGTIKAMEKIGYVMEIYTIAPPYTPWYETTKGSQGMEAKIRLEHIDDELSRIPKYQQQGNLATFEELFSYLEARERGALRLTKDLPFDLQS